MELYEQLSVGLSGRRGQFVLRRSMIHLTRIIARAGRSTWEPVTSNSTAGFDSDLPRKEVIQPHLPVRLPCYDFVPITDPTFDGCLLAVGPPASGVASFHDVTGGVYKAREHIHRRMLTGGY